MYPTLIETIKIQNGTIYNLSYHNARLNRTRQALFGYTHIINLQEHLAPPHDKELYRCRVSYRKHIERVEYIRYTPKVQKKFAIVESDITYPYKFANREAFDRLKSAYRDVDDIIMSRNAILSDTTIANIAFFDGEIWWTPQNPLLEGTMRQYLLDCGKIKAKELKKSEISSYHGFAIMNAMVGFKIIKDYTIRS
ncbi:MAG: aminotransferase class IV [Campylobacterales bacterium]|nr:aminotransferase class IV [Campylobacterales bacterium]